MKPIAGATRLSNTLEEGSLLGDMLRSLENHIDEMRSFRSKIPNPPRILVTAPSNAAVDEIVLRILQQGFRDSNQQIYRPNIIRLGRGANAAVNSVSLNFLVDQILAEDKTVKEKQYQTTSLFKTR